MIKATIQERTAGIMTDKKQNAMKYGEVVAKCWEDEAYKKRFIEDPESVLTEAGFVVEEGVTHIGGFMYCTELTQVTIPETVTEEITETVAEEPTESISERITK